MQGSNSIFCIKIVIFLVGFAIYFTRKQADLKDLIFQDEREDAHYMLTPEELGELIFQDKS